MELSRCGQDDEYKNKDTCNARTRLQFRMAFADRPRFVWRLRTRTLPLGERTRLMAIVNITPDSFSGDGTLRADMPLATGQKFALGAAVEAADNGADIIDLGAESTRPASHPLTSDEEQARLMPVVEAVLRERPEAVVSVDTYHAATARACARAGAEIVNDVSGLTWDEAMASAIASTGCGLVLMHTRGRPQEWAAQQRLAHDEVLPTVFAGLMQQLALAEAAGIPDEKIVADPGFGFGKRGAENWALLAGLARLHELGRPLLAGISRKSFLGDVVRPVQSIQLEKPEARRIASVSAGVAAILSGAHILRVHDLQAAREAAAVADAILAGGNSDD
jgi:dihydropteroate synthase